MGPMEHNGEKFEYQIFVRKLADDETKSYIVPGDKNFKQIKTGDTFQKYEVKVVARNTQGPAIQTPQEVFGFSGMGSKSLLYLYQRGRSHPAR